MSLRGSDCTYKNDSNSYPRSFVWWRMRLKAIETPHKFLARSQGYCISWNALSLRTQLFRQPTPRASASSFSCYFLSLTRRFEANGWDRPPCRMILHKTNGRRVGRRDEGIIGNEEMKIHFRKRGMRNWRRVGWNQHKALSGWVAGRWKRRIDKGSWAPTDEVDKTWERGGRAAFWTSKYISKLLTPLSHEFFIGSSLISIMWILLKMCIFFCSGLKIKFNEILK